VKNNSEIIFPKVLIIDNFNQKEANGITIRNMFINWPIDKIAVVHREQSPISDVVVDNINDYYFLGKKEIKYVWPFSLFLNVTNSKIINIESINSSINSSSELTIKFNFKKKLFNLFKPLIYYSGLAYFQKKNVISEELVNWIHKFEPDYIYSNAGSISNIKFQKAIKHKLGIKLIIHIFDDFVNVPNKTILKKLIYKITNKELKDLIKMAEVRLVISDKMAFEYNKRYDELFYKFHNPINIESWTNTENTPKFSLFTFCYIGKVNLDVSSTIKLFINEIEKINGNKKLIDFHIYSQSNVNSWISLINKNVRKYYKGSLSQDKIPAVLTKYDGLLLPLSFNEENQQYLKLSLSTKTSEYMISKVPIFLFAPSNLAVSEYLIENNCAFNASNKDKLNENILEFIKNIELRNNLSKKAYELALNEHTTEATTKRLLRILSGNKIK
jgi:glycosyltransferase involved in cell wall biosynthesis